MDFVRGNVIGPFGNFHLVGGADAGILAALMSASREKWDQRYQQLSAQQPPLAAEVLRQNAHLLPSEGKALDIACGLGGNALLLAKAGLTVTAQDISEKAIIQLQQFAQQAGLPVETVVADITAVPPKQAFYDVITVSYFLDRALCPRLTAALKPGGLLFYQTWCRDKPSDIGPSNPDYLLTENELLQLFAGLQPRVYREETDSGDLQQGLRHVAFLIAQRPE